MRKKNKLFDLFDLINVMSRGEKRTFVEEINKDSEYIQLYKKLSKVKKIEKLKTSEFENFLPSIRTKLYNKILNHIHGKIKEGDAHMEVESWFEKTVILEKRGLYDQSRETSSKAEKLAIKIEDYQALIKIKRFQRKVILERTNTQQERNIREITSDLSKYQDHLNEEIIYENLYYPLFMTYRHGKRPKIKDTPQNGTFSPDNLEYFLFKKELSTEASFYSKSYFYRAKIFYFLNRREYLNAHEIFKEILSLWESKPEMKELYQSLYMIDLVNFINNLHNQDIYSEEFEKYLKILDEIKCETFNEEAEKFQNEVHLKLLFHLNRGEAEECTETINFFEKNLNKYKDKINKSREISILFNIFSIYWIRVDYGQCLKWADKIQTPERTDHRKDVQKLLKVLLLIIHYEQEHQNISSLVDTSYKNLSRANQIDTFDSLVISCLRKLVKINSTLSKAKYKENKVSILIETKDKLKQLDKKPYGYDEVLVWIENSIKR